MAKFKPGDIISPTLLNHGFENAKVLEIFTKKKKEYYLLKITNGFATIPLHAEDAYELASPDMKKKRKLSVDDQNLILDFKLNNN